MSFEEPKAPIVRIRKKKVKKKSKENDIVHLPVRASRQTRYSSLTTPVNPQSKSRECCRHIFASCFKIPVCRSLCFRCILPKCYDGQGSDDDDAEARDEGYDSQNRRSSDITPSPAGGAEGGASGSRDVEMTELKSETVTLIPPPRAHVSTNDYRQDPCGSDSNNGRTLNSYQGDDGEMTYIEVESVSLSGDLEHIPETEGTGKERTGSSRSNTERKFTMEYEEPIHAGVEAKYSNKSKTTVSCQNSVKTVASDYVDFDAADLSDDESKYYVNESILHKPAEEVPKLDKNDTIAYAEIKIDKVEQVSKVSEDGNNVDKVDASAAIAKDYANFCAVNDLTVELATTKGTHSQEEVYSLSRPIKNDKPHEYVNVNPLVNTEPTNINGIVIEGMVDTSKDDIGLITKYMTTNHADSDLKKEKIETKTEEGTTESITEEVVALDNDGDTMPDNRNDTDKEDKNKQGEFVCEKDDEKLINKENKKAECVSGSDSDSDECASGKKGGKITDQTKLI